MVNTNLFSSFSGSLLPETDTFNEARGKAYKLPAKEALAQLATTGCLSNTYYAKAEDQLVKVLTLSKEVDAVFLAKLALYSREEGFMKDMPALLAAILSVRDSELLRKVFPRVIDNLKMLRNFVQIIRSGQVGRKSFGTVSKRLIQTWLRQKSDEQLFRGNIGNNPSLADIIKLIRPKPHNAFRKNLYRYLLGQEIEGKKICKLVEQFEKFKKTPDEAEIPDLDFRMLDNLPLGDDHWKSLAKNARWMNTRMNLNNFAKHGVFKDSEVTKIVADKLRNKEEVLKARQFPYQLLTTYLYTKDNHDIPSVVNMALQDALDFSTENVPEISGKLFICVDISGSMGSPVTGSEKGKPASKARCVDVASLIASTLLRKNPDAELILFNDFAGRLRLNTRDSVVTNALMIASMLSGGTSCSAALHLLNENNAKGDVVLYVSDDQSWKDFYRQSGTALAREWDTFQRRNRESKLVLIDLQPYTTTQVSNSKNVLNVGGFSDACFDVISSFLNGSSKSWVEAIEKVNY